MQRAERIARLTALVEQRRLTRREFRGLRGHRAAVVYADETIPERPGTPVESIIAALCPEMADHRDFDNFDDSLFPPWFAHLTMWMEDHGREHAWESMTHTYAGMLARSDILSASDWERIRLMLLQRPLMELALISRLELLETALCALDTAVEKIHFPDSIRVDLLAQFERERAHSGHPQTHIIDRAMGVLSDPCDTHLKTIFNEACKLLPPKKSRRPGVVTKLTNDILRIIGREIDIQQMAYTQTAIEAPVATKALPAAKPQTPSTPTKRKKKVRPSA